MIMKNISIIKVKKERGSTKMYFSSIEEMHEMYVYLLKKNRKRKIKILKETKDKRVSSIMGKYYSELQDITIGDYNILEISDKISLRHNDIQHYKEDYYYTLRKEFDNRKDGFSYIGSEFGAICYERGVSGLRQFHYDLLTIEKFFDHGYPKLSSLRFDVWAYSVEELHDIYLYFLKLEYHTKILVEDINEYPIKRKKFKTTQKAKGDNSGTLMAITIMLDKNFHHFLKFMEDFENLYWKMNYTFRIINVPSLTELSNRFKYKKQIKLFKISNYGDCI